MSDKKEPVKWAGKNVIAKIGGKEVGPIYCVQVHDGIATLQGAEKHQVKVEEIIKEAHESVQ